LNLEDDGVTGFKRLQNGPQRRNFFHSSTVDCVNDISWKKIRLDAAALVQLNDSDTRPVVVLIAGARLNAADVKRCKVALEKVLEEFSAADDDSQPLYLS
jgi:hypothetical protein